MVCFTEPPAPSANCEGASETNGVSVHIPGHVAAANAHVQPSSSVNVALSSVSPPVGAGAPKDDLTHACSPSEWCQPFDAVTQSPNDSSSVSTPPHEMDASLEDALSALNAEIADAHHSFQDHSFQDCKHCRGLNPEV
jgi:hypothetical protein